MTKKIYTRVCAWATTVEIHTHTHTYIRHAHTHITHTLACSHSHTKRSTQHTHIPIVHSHHVHTQLRLSVSFSKMPYTASLPLLLSQLFFQDDSRPLRRERDCGRDGDSTAPGDAEIVGGLPEPTGEPAPADSADLPLFVLGVLVLVVLEDVAEAERDAESEYLAVCCRCCWRRRRSRSP